MESNDYLYRVKNVRDGHERVMRESQLTAWSVQREGVQGEKPPR